ncbi:unnamed protein product [Mucor circinelloides]
MRLSCSICLEQAEEDAVLVALTVCGHVFDAECITQCMIVSDKCPLCNQSTFGHHPAFKRVYFSVHDGDLDGNDALVAAKEKLKSVTDEINTLHREYDDLALNWTMAKDELNTCNHEKTLLQEENADKDAQIQKLTHNLQTSKAHSKEDIDKMNLKLIAKHKSIDLLTKNLDKSNKRIKSLKEELEALKSNGSQDNLPSKSRYRDQNFKTKYYDLNKEHRALKDKMDQLEKKFIDLTLTTSAPPSSILPHKTEALQLQIQQLEKQLQTSMTKENKLLKEVMRFKQLKQEAVKEKEELQAKLANAEAVINTFDITVKKEEPPHEEID